METVRLSSIPAVGRKVAADRRAIALVASVLVVTTLVGTLLFWPFGVMSLLVGTLIASALWQGEATRNLHRMVVGVMPVTHRGRCPALWDAASDCAAATGLPMPRLYLLGPTVSAQAASWGIDEEMSVGVQMSLVRRIPAEWVKAAVAHEFAHHAMDDIRWSSVILIGRIWARWTSLLLCAAGIGLVGMGAQGAPLAFVVGGLGWAATVLIGKHVMPHVRYCREYAADALGVAISRDPVAAVGLMLYFAVRSGDKDVDPRPRAGKSHPPPLLRVQAIIQDNVETFFGSRP